MNRKSSLTPRASAHLDFIRGLAAIAVLAGHIRTLFFVEYKDIHAGQSALLQLIYALTGLGHQAVMVFFVLSGFFVGGSVLSTIERWSWKRYLVSRLSRLYLVLAPALILTAAADWIAYRLPAGHFYFDRPIAYLNTTPLNVRHSVSIFLGNLLYLQGIAVPTFGSNSPLWSISFEFWYYILFPAVALVLFARVGIRSKAVHCAGALLLAAWLPRGIVLQFAIWMLGAAIHFTPAVPRMGRVSRMLLTLGAGAVFFAVLMLARVQRIPEAWSDYAVGTAFAVWLYLLVRMPGTNTVAWNPYRRCAELLSKCSYSVYAIHFPLVLLLRTYLGTAKWLPSMENLAVGGTIVCGVFFAGFLFSRLTEAHTEKVRARAMRILEPRRTRAAVVAT